MSLLVAASLMFVCWLVLIGPTPFLAPNIPDRRGSSAAQAGAGERRVPPSPVAASRPLESHEISQKGAATGVSLLHFQLLDSVRAI